MLNKKTLKLIGSVKFQKNCEMCPLQQQHQYNTTTDNMLSKNNQSIVRQQRSKGPTRRKTNMKQSIQLVLLTTFFVITIFMRKYILISYRFV
jgi:hypothetical protein